VSHFSLALHLARQEESMSRARTAIAIAVWLAASTATAQDAAPTSRLTLSPPDAPRWDASGHLTWLGRHLQPSLSWDRWYEVATGGATVGYFWTPHLKTELDVTTSTQGEAYSVEPVPPLPPFPTFVQREHEFHLMTVSAGLTAQFFENAWFHPFVGAGIDVIREREQIQTTQIASPRDPRAPPLPPPQVETQTQYLARPFVSAGFKVYVSERAFIRTDWRTAFSSDGVTTLAWRNGIGFDF
jgi:outer membrane protein W